MLTIRNAEGKELMKINDDGTEEIKDATLKEQMAQAEKQEDDK